VQRFTPLLIDIEFGAHGTGQFGFIAVRGWLDCHTEEGYGRPRVKFSCQGDDELAGWITNLTLAEKDRLLLRVVCDYPATVRAELLRRFREQSTPAAPSVPRRMVADLLEMAA
jgi:hypothetical protein